MSFEIQLDSQTTTGVVNAARENSPKKASLAFLFASPSIFTFKRPVDIKRRTSEYVDGLKGQSLF